ncbi:hypothetical protein EST55_11420 [Idiomarina sp. 29L]|uniref:hypothetical protein n=1 Tax=Idiomarina sp. 29L TaxID=2508877 RepID=UPI0010130D4F|nr:hypothetical protein [Idiomarina sp. 29L]RXS41517.1 hypothetical protein EST55_11420 [Idiomarina sp. 29L]
MSAIEFDRNIDKVFAQADELGVWINCGWTVGIPKDVAVDYVNSRNTNPNAGFFDHQGNVILSHNGGKITFTQQEGEALIDLIKTAYL